MWLLKISTIFCLRTSTCSKPRQNCTVCTLLIRHANDVTQDVTEKYWMSRHTPKTNSLLLLLPLYKPFKRLRPSALGANATCNRKVRKSFVVLSYSPDLNPLDYCIWDVLHDIVCEGRRLPFANLQDLKDTWLSIYVSDVSCTCDGVVCAMHTHHMSINRCGCSWLNAWKMQTE